MNRSLQTLRGLCAMVIFLHHACAPSALSADATDMSIAIFFMLSGFTLGIANEGREVQWVPFMRRRLAHIYPLYILCQFVGLTVFPIAGLAAILKFGMSIAMMQSWLPVPYMAFLGNPVAWFVSSLMLIYLLYPLLHKALQRHPGRFFAGAAVAYAAYFAVVPCVDSQHVYFYIYVWPVSRLFDFVLGMILFEGYRRLGRRDESHSCGMRHGRIVALGVAAVITAVFLWLGPEIPANFRLASWWWLPAAAVVMSLALADSGTGLAAHILHAPALVAFGNISFSFYLVHVIVIKALEACLTGAWLVAAAFAATLAAAILLQRFLVAPLNKRLR